jgi:hypothetical protein
MGVLKDIGHDLMRDTTGEAAAGTATGIKLATHMFGAPMWGVPGAIGVLALLSEWDHNHEKDKLREEYENEIAAKLGKDPHKVTVEDMQRVAKDNPTINEALQRSRSKRNLSIGITATGMILSFVASAVAVSAFAATGIGAIVLGGVVTFGAFMIAEKVMMKFGEHALHLNEPPLKDAEHNPRIQDQLSLPNQVRLIERMQGRRVPVSQEQVLTTFIAANPDLDRGIASRYGAPFSALPDSARIAVMQNIGPTINLEGLTSDINNRAIRAQELAFVVQGQNSGVARVESPRVTALEKANIQLTSQLTELKQRVAAHAAHFGESVQSITHAAKDKMGFANANVAGTPLGVNAQAPATAPEPESTAFRERLGARASNAGLSEVDKVVARRQQQGAAQMSVG